MPDARLGKIRYGKDDELEALADQWLSRGVGDNKRCPDRDKEKMLYEFGLVGDDELEFYDPTNDWDTHDEVFVRLYGNIDDASPSLCSGDDGNIRARSRMDPHLSAGVWGRAGGEERNGLSHHVEDDDDWGPSFEVIPLLGANELRPGLSKICSKCGLRKLLAAFSPDPRNKGDGLHSWCRKCHNKHRRLTYEKRKNRRSKD